MPTLHRFVRPNRARVWLVAMVQACALGGLALPAMGAENLAEPDVAVESAKSGLSRSPDIPWYDSQTDDFRAAEVKPPRNRNFPTGSTTLAELLLRLGWILLAVLLIYLVYLIVRSYLNLEVQDGVAVERVAAGGDISRVEELPVALEKSPSDYLDEAERLYRRGEYARAIVYLFSHQLLQLDRRHWIRLVKGKTNRQYLREVRRAPAPAAAEVAKLFEQTVLLFEEVFFGKRLPPKAHIDATWNQIARFDSLVARVEEQAA